MVASTRDTGDPGSPESAAYLALGKRLALAPLACVCAACKTSCRDLRSLGNLLDTAKPHENLLMVAKILDQLGVSLLPIATGIPKS